MTSLRHDLRLLAPARGEVLHEKRPAFEWAPYPGAVSYELRVEHVASVGKIALRTEVREPRFRPEEALPNSVYLWAVTALDGERKPLANNKSPDDTGWVFSIVKLKR